MSDERDWGPYCMRSGCRGRWWPDQPHTLCEKAGMSDNPADSLRRELDERQLGWLVGAAINRWQRGGPLTISEHVARDLWPPLMAWVEAARADARAQAFTEAADAIEAIHRPVECANLRCKVGMFCAVCQEAEEEIGCKWPCDSVAVVRGLGEETASVDSKINKA